MSFENRGSFPGSGDASGPSKRAIAKSRAQYVVHRHTRVLGLQGAAALQVARWCGACIADGQKCPPWTPAMARPRRKRRTIRRRRDLRSKSGMLYDSVSAARAQSFGEQSRRQHAKRCALSARERCAAAVTRTPFRRARPARGNAPRQTPSTRAGLHVVLGHLRRHLRYL